MSRFDVQDQVMSAQAITTGTAVSANSRQKTAAVDLNPGRKMAFMVIPTADAAGTVVATSYKFDFIQSTVTALTSPDILGSVTIDGSAVQAGSPIEVPCAAPISKAHLGVQITVTGGTAPTAAFDAFLVPADEIPLNPYFTKHVDVDTNY